MDLIVGTALIQNGYIWGRVRCGHFGFSMDVQRHWLWGELIELFDRFLIAGQPVIGLVMPECAAGSTNERIVIRIFVGVKLDDAEDSR